MIMATVPKTANQMTDGDPLSTVKFLVTVCFLFSLLSMRLHFTGCRTWLNILAVRHYNSSFVCILLK
ncbi:hypothetical protein LINPERPRIM_LOCUS38379 [Linum perenne]